MPETRACFSARMCSELVCICLAFLLWFRRCNIKFNHTDHASHSVSLSPGGFAHSAFVLGYEAGIDKSPIDGNTIPPTALTELVQRGLHMIEMEANMNNIDTNIKEEFSFIQPMDLITKSVDVLQKLVQKQKFSIENIDKALEPEHEVRRRLRDKGKIVQDREGSRDKRLRLEASPSTRSVAVEAGNKKLEDRAHTDTERMKVSAAKKPVTSEISGAHVMILEGHSSEVCACAWSTSSSLLASGSGDSTARIWTTADDFSNSHYGPSNVLVLKKIKSRGSEKTQKSNDVTTLDWNGDGTLLAIGSYDAQARVWSPDGELKYTLSKHKGPVFSSKWNKRGDYLLTGSCNKTAIVWDVKSDAWKQHFHFHQGPTLDVDWKTNTSFASSSTDHMIHVCKIGETQPVKTFAGHQEIYTSRWNPTGPGSNNRSQQMLARRRDSFDSTVWGIAGALLLFMIPPVGVDQDGSNKEGSGVSGSGDPGDIQGTNGVPGDTQGANGVPGDIQAAPGDIQGVAALLLAAVVSANRAADSANASAEAAAASADAAADAARAAAAPSPWGAATKAVAYAATLGVGWFIMRRCESGLNDFHKKWQSYADKFHQLGESTTQEASKAVQDAAKSASRISLGVVFSFVCLRGLSYIFGSK